MISRSTDVRSALRSRQRGFLLNPARFGGGGGGGGSLLWNPLDKGAGIALSNSDRTASAEALGGGVRATISKSSGRWYAEWVLTARGEYAHWGMATSGTQLTAISNSFTAGGNYLLWREDSLVAWPGDSPGSQGPSPANGGVFGVSVDFTSGALVTLYYNGSLVYARDIGAGTYFPYFNGGGSSGAVVTINVSPTYLPSGFTYWS